MTTTSVEFFNNFFHRPYENGETLEDRVVKFAVEFTKTKVFQGINFAELEKQRTSLAYILAGADKDIRSMTLEAFFEDLEGIQNFLDHVTDVAAEIYGEDVVLPISYAIGSAIDAADWADLNNKEI